MLYTKFHTMTSQFRVTDRKQDRTMVHQFLPEYFLPGHELTSDMSSSRLPPSCKILLQSTRSYMRGAHVLKLSSPSVWDERLAST